MSIRKRPVPQYVRISEFLKLYPDITDHRLRWALRHRRDNGLEPFVRTYAWRARELMLDHAAVYRFLTATVGA